jgi:hypothetical protein
MPGARRTHSLACEMKKAHERSHHRFAGFTQHSLRNGFTAYFALSPVTGLFCHRRLRNTFRKLDASVGASGPHDFAVRVSIARLAAPKRPSHPAPNVRDDRDTPLL